MFLYIWETVAGIPVTKYESVGYYMFLGNRVVSGKMMSEFREHRDMVLLCSLVLSICVLLWPRLRFRHVISVFLYQQNKKTK